MKLFKTLFDKGCLTRNLIFLYISNLCQPQKVSNKVTFSRSKGAGSYKKRKNQLYQKSDVVSFKATFVSSYILSMLTNVLPGAWWIRDMGT